MSGKRFFSAAIIGLMISCCLAGCPPAKDDSIASHPPGKYLAADFKCREFRLDRVISTGPEGKAIIVTPDGEKVEVQVNDCLGRSAGKVVNIEKDHVIVIEQYIAPEDMGYIYTIEYKIYPDRVEEKPGKIKAENQ